MARSNAVAVIDSRTRAEHAERYLGPAEVVGIGAGAVDLAVEGRVVSATLALAVPYEPALGDQVLLITEGDARYVIGVLAGAGKTILAFDGDVELRSNTGVLRLNGKRGVELGAPQLDIHVGALQIVAQSVVERVTSFTQRVRGLLSVQVGSRHEIVQQSTTTQARSSTLVTEETAKINGKAILLG